MRGTNSIREISTPVEDFNKAAFVRPCWHDMLQHVYSSSSELHRVVRPPRNASIPWGELRNAGRRAAAGERPPHSRLPERHDIAVGPRDAFVAEKLKEAPERSGRQRGWRQRDAHPAAAESKAVASRAEQSSRTPSTGENKQRCRRLLKSEPHHFSGVPPDHRSARQPKQDSRTTSQGLYFGVKLPWTAESSEVGRWTYACFC